MASSNDLSVRAGLNDLGILRTLSGTVQGSDGYRQSSVLRVDFNGQ